LTQMIYMRDSFEHKNRGLNIPYDIEEPEDITESLMRLSELSLHDFLATEPDIYTFSDLKVRYR